MPNFTYTRGIPASSHNPSTDQSDMQVNNDSVDDLLLIDHYSFNNQANFSGYHKKVSLVNNPGPFPTPGGVGSVLYGSNNDWVFTTASLAGAGVQMTVGTKPPIALANGSSFLPGGILIQWGTGNTVLGTLTQAYTYAFSTFFSATATVGALGPGNSVISINTLNPAQITISTSNQSFQPNSVQVFWMAIGLA